MKQINKLNRKHIELEDDSDNRI